MHSEGRPQTRSVFREPMPQLCHGCLSSDRELSSIGEFVNMYRNLCDIKTPVAGVSTGIYLCWECTAMLKRFQMFRKQVNNAQTLLNLAYNDYRNKKSLPESLSRLKASKTNHDDIILNEPEPDIKPLPEIKHEIDQFEDIKNIETKQEKDQDDYFENIEFLDDNNDLENSEFLGDNNDLKNEEFLDDNDDFDNAEYIDDNKDFTNLEDIKSEDPTLINKLPKSKMRKSFHEYKKRTIRKNYRYIRLPEEMIVAEQARESILSVLWKKGRHISRGSGTNCKMCMKGFCESESIETHNRKYHNECIGPHVCSICSTRYPTQAELASHVSSHNTIYCCVVCCLRSLTMKDAVTHASGHKRVVKCKLCRYYCLKVKPDYFEHYKLIHTQFVCDHCGKKCLRKHLLREHITRHHIEPKCDRCGIKFASSRYVKDHNALVHTTDRTEASFCVVCNIQFDNRLRYQRHLATSSAHAFERQTSKNKELYKCLVCDKRYKRKTTMMQHYRYVHVAKTTQYCQECDKYFLNRTSYVRHQLYTHEGAKKKLDKLCTVCGRGFSENRILTNHMRTHTGERPFECAYCDARFAQRVARDTHQRKQHNRNNKAIK